MSHFSFHYLRAAVYDYLPKNVQEKRTEVVENKVYRMQVSNAFSE